MIGGWGNLRTLIRRKRQAEDRAIVDTPVILTKRAPLKVLIDIKTGSVLNLYLSGLLTNCLVNLCLCNFL